MRSYTWAVWGACLVIAAALAVATVLRPLASPPTLEQQVMSIAADVRCPECQGESAAASNSAASLAIRAEIARDLAAGEGRGPILRQIAAEYGEWILYRPPERGAFLLLWGAPLLALGAVAAVLIRLVSRRAASPDPIANGGGDSGSGEPPREVLGRLARYL